MRYPEEETRDYDWEREVAKLEIDNGIESGALDNEKSNFLTNIAMENEQSQAFIDKFITKLYQATVDSGNISNRVVIDILDMPEKLKKDIENDYEQMILEEMERTCQKANEDKKAYREELKQDLKHYDAA